MRRLKMQFSGKGIDYGIGDVCPFVGAVGLVEEGDFILLFLRLRSCK